MTTTHERAAGRSAVSLRTRCATIAREIPFTCWHSGWFRNCRDATCRYWALDKQAGKLIRKLCREDDPAKRSALLDDLASAEQSMADIFPAAFGRDPIEREGGRDMSESMALSAGLVRVLAYCERGLIAPGVASYPDGFTNDECYLLGELTIVRDRMKRADLLDRLCAASVLRVGGQAAETLVTLARTERKIARRTS